LGNNKLKISFSANEPIKYNFIYKNKISEIVSSFNIDYFETCPPLKKLCSFEIEVESGVKYFYKLEAQDFWNNLTSLTGEFEIPKTEISENKESKTTDSSKTFDTSILEKPFFIQEKKERKTSITQKIQDMSLKEDLEKTVQETKKSEEILLEEKNKN